MKITIEVNDDDIRRALRPLLQPDEVSSTAQDPPRLLSVNEVAYRLGVSRPKVYQLISKGEIEALVVGRSRKIPVSAMDEFLAKSRERLRFGRASSRESGSPGTVLSATKHRPR